MKLLLTVFILIICFGTYCQNEASTCFFGKVGLDFRSVPPQPIYPISMISWESPASICDSVGNILFYTNGGNSPLAPSYTGAVWNANNAIMDNGIIGDSGGCISSYQGSIIVPFPSNGLKSNSNLYYIFMKDCLESNYGPSGYNSGLTYAVVNMDQNGGLGKVIQKYINLVPYSVATGYATAHEPVTAILHGNNTDYWLFSYTNDSLYRMKVSSTGIDSLTMLVPGSSKISISPNRDFLCSGKDVYQFDAFTGNISFLGSVTANSLELTFSPDGSKLYSVDNNVLYQYDLTQSNFLATKTWIAALNNQYRLFLAPDHKIYLFLDNRPVFDGQVRCPNSPGSSCDFSMTQTWLGGGSTGSDCTNLMAHYLYYSGNCTASVDEIVSNSNRKLIRIVDLMGRETEDKPNTLLIYVYSDGITEKVLWVE